MDINDIIGQEQVKKRLLDDMENGRVPHAIMLCGAEGYGGLPLAIAYAQRLLGNSAMAEKLMHPDLHFAFPIYKKNKAPKATYCDDFIADWREQCLRSPYFGMAEWMQTSGADNQQLIIYADESDAISRKLSLKSSQGGYKVLIMWLPEKMHETCANKLLKLLEEPPAQTVFLLVSEQPDRVLQTIRSRTQMVYLQPLAEGDIAEALTAKYSVMETEARRLAHSAMGSMTAAIRAIASDSDAAMFFELFVSLMRLSYARKVKEMKQWADQVASLGRERQKNFLNYCQQMIRENFIYNFGQHSTLNYMNEQEAQFAVKFAPFINENNVIGIMEELALAQRDIHQNASAKIVFFDFALKMIVLIKNR